ncbi:MAG: bifunctional DNA-formamidopyrimidine glycosylase/DNA-(apurinic or apyrimidinic site) lyase [Candidatus Neomarinimicrobiota bacterium]
MPELPEVETVVRHLRPRLGGRLITGFTAYWPKVTAPVKPQRFARQVVGRTIERVRRRGKFIILQLDRGLVHVHLRMTGRLLLLPPGQTGDLPHLTAAFTLSGDDRLLFRDVRKFGRIGYLESPVSLEARLGPEPLSEEFTPQVLRKMLAGRRRQIKPLLLDQTFIAGLGNIYVDEVLFSAGIHPLSLASRLDARRATTLHGAIREVLTDSIAHNGTTIINFGYGDNEAGGFRERLLVFGRQEEPCLVCATPLVKTKVAQRGTYLCPHCQPA